MVRLHNPPRNGQPQTASLRLGRVKGLEDSLPLLVSDARALVRNGNINPIVTTRSRDRHLAASRRRLNGVQQQIERNI